MESPPVLLLIFNRPDLTGQVFSRVREAQPSKLFVAGDGPRADHPKDQRLCDRAREVATDVDWDCEVHTLFRDENLGCKKAVSSAITWFFKHVEAGIILEDDCVPHPSFFWYCGVLLDRYQDDDRIMTISGNNFQPEEKTYRSSYYFSAYMHCWGWATWGKAWSYYNGKIPTWKSLRGTGWLRGWLGTDRAADYWRGIFDRVAHEEIDSWAYPWMYACWREHSLHVLPSVNLVSNVGFGERSTHTQNPDDAAASLPAKPIYFPLSSPKTMIRDYEADRYTSEEHFGIRPDTRSWRRKIGRWIPDRMKSTARSLLKHIR